jgi:UDP-N-acetylmuramate dehydrogenase
MIDIKENILLAALTTFRIGGPARYYVEIKNEKELDEALAWAKEKNLDFFVLGGGSNVLVNDKGYAGLVIRIKSDSIIVEGESLVSAAGVPLIKAVNMAAAEGLSGLESLAGIPGTVGGAIRGNAGAYGGTMESVVAAVNVLDTKTGQIRQCQPMECEFAYRSSLFKKNSNLVVVSVRLQLKKENPAEVLKRTEQTIQSRISKQLQGSKSAGSFFMNPVVTDENLIRRFEQDKNLKAKDERLPAGWFIDQCGLRGKKMGGAMVSVKHANYLVNTGEAKAEDIVMLSSYIKQQVRDEFGVQLQEEITYLGF